ncbi:MAG: L,D-transpeptidase family protein [Hyphomicrobium sp.]|uniref:L,D-transpeptidase family protein n=1 Tax=Hyphomicrobium sp. TaxID=82 RepID=UPI0039E3F13C
MAVPWMKRSTNRRRKPAALIFVRALSQSARRGYLEFGALKVPCALGRAGVKALKREGDSATPRGEFKLSYLLYRQGRPRPRSAIRLKPIRRDDGWCDCPGDRNYNRPVSLPYPASAEHLWRRDGLYDVVVVLDYNIVPRVRNRGSAIFMHIARKNFEPTEGCVALRDNDLRRLVSRLPRNSKIAIRL